MNCKVTKVTIFAPLESVGTVWCDYGGLYHIQIDGKEFVTDKATYWRIINARSMLRINTPNKKEEE